ncbi:MAG: hypothetical protein RJQ09_05820 [Cyclobacteriaceae bacterium]
MKQRLLIILLIIQISDHAAFSQFTTNPPRQTNNFTFEQGLFDSILYKEFTTLVNAGNDGSLGNFVSVDTDEKTIKAGAILTRPSTNGTTRNSVLSVNIEGGNSKGILPILSSGSTSNKFGAELVLNKLLGNATLDYSLDSINKYTKKWDKFQSEYEKIRAENMDATFRSRMDYKVKQVDSMITVNEAKMAENDEKIKKVKDGTIEHSGLIVQKDKYYLENLKLSAEKAVYQDSLSNAVTYSAFKRNLADNNRITRQSNIGWPANLYSISWLTLTGGFKGNVFSYINQKDTLLRGVDKKNYVAPSIRLAYNNFKGSVITGIHFFSISMEVKAMDNFSSLSTSKFKTTTRVGAKTLEIEKNVFTGEYKKNIWQGSWKMDYYRFIHNQSKLGYHFYPEFWVRDTGEASLNFGIGVLITFKDKKKEKSIINAELFANALDIANENDLDDNIFRRTELGIRIDFPITFKKY